MPHFTEFLRSSHGGDSVSVSLLQMYKVMFKESEWHSQTLNPDLSVSSAQGLHHYDTWSYNKLNI